MPILKNRAPINSPTSLDDIKKKIGQFGNNLAYLESNQKQLVMKYNDNWVAIFNGDVVAHDKHFGDLVGKLSKMGLTEDQVVAKYLSDSEVMALYFDR